MSQGSQAAQGALSGASQGMMFGPYGMAAGAIAGGLMGAFGGGPPSIPSALNLTNKAISQYYYGLNPKDLQKLNNLLALQTAGTDLSPKQQHQLDMLQTKSENRAILPQEIAAQQKFLPQFEQLSQQYLSDQANFLGTQYQGLTNQLNPQYGQMQTNTGNYLNSLFSPTAGATPGTPGSMTLAGLTPDQQQYFSGQLAAQQAAQGLTGGLGSQNTALALTNLDMMQRQQNMQNIMGYGSAFPNQAAAILGLGMSTSPTGMGLAGGSVTPTSFSDYQNMVNSIAGLNYQTALNNQSQQGGGMFGMGGGGGGMGGMFGGGGGMGGLMNMFGGQGGAGAAGGASGFGNFMVI